MPGSSPLNSDFETPLGGREEQSPPAAGLEPAPRQLSSGTFSVESCKSFEFILFERREGERERERQAEKQRH